MKKGEIQSYLDHTLNASLNNDGIVLLGPERQHRGNFSTAESAKRYALFNFMLDNLDGFRQSICNRLNTSFGGGCSHDYFTLKNKLKEKGLNVPSDIGTTSPISFCIDFGEPQGSKYNDLIKANKALLKELKNIKAYFDLNDAIYKDSQGIRARVNNAVNSYSDEV